MKTIAILLLILTGIIIVVGMMFYFFGFIMSFDAPGSDKDPSAWGMRALMFSPIIVFIGCLIVGLLALKGGQYLKSAILGGIAPLLSLGFVIWMFVYSFKSLNEYKQLEKERAELKEKYPLETYTRQSALGVDTILVWPEGIVAYRLHVEGMANTWNGPLGDLDKQRKVVSYHRTADTRLMIEEVGEFMDGNGVRFTDKYAIR